MGLFNRDSNSSFSWGFLTELSKFNEAIELSANKPVLFFKHSTRCGISTMILRQFELSWNTDLTCELFLLDLLKNKELSNQMAFYLQVIHQSPQVILVINKNVIFHASHHDIDTSHIEKHLLEL